jgi:hypothetical protein
MDQNAIANFQRTINDFEVETGKNAEEGMKVIGRATCKRLAMTVQPYGLNGGGKMAKFEKSIANQVDRAWFGTNLGAFPATNNMKDAHYAARRNGVVPKRLFRKEKGKPWLDLISRSELETYKKIAMAKAFRAKAAWVKIHNELGKSKLRGVSHAVTRHLPSARGSLNISGKHIDLQLQIENETPYIKSIQYTEDVAKAAAEGMRLGLKWMETATDKAVEKAEKKLK